MEQRYQLLDPPIVERALPGFRLRVPRKEAGTRFARTNLMLMVRPGRVLVAAFRRVVGSPRRTRLHVRWRKHGGWLGTHLTDTVPFAPQKERIEQTARAMNALGEQRLADEYDERRGWRTPDQVRSSADAGDLYSWLVQQRAPKTVVEFGSAFGVSGMYFAAGLEGAGAGHLYTFDINSAWAEIAERNIRLISNRFTMTRGAFEDHVEMVVRAPVDLALVDGIHTYEFVIRQYRILKPRMARGGIILLDDIDFPKPGARMREVWEEIAAERAVIAAAEIQNRLGLIEFAGDADE